MTGTRRNNGLDAECGQALGQAIGRNAMLTCLDLGDNPLGPEPMQHIAQGLSSSGLRDLRLDRVGMETDGACALAQVRACQGPAGKGRLNMANWACHGTSF